MASNISGLSASFSKSFINSLSHGPFASQLWNNVETWFRSHHWDHRENEASVSSSDFREFGQLQQEEEHAGNLRK
jgi:hypothetical protein